MLQGWMSSLKVSSWATLGLILDTNVSQQCLVLFHPSDAFDVSDPSYIEYAYEKKLLEKGSKDGKLAEQVNDQCNDILEDAGENRVLIPKCEAL